MAGTLNPLCLPTSVSSTLAPRADRRSSCRTSRRRSTIVTLRQTYGGVLRRSASKPSNFSRPLLVSCAGKSPEDFTEQGKESKDAESEFVAPRVTPDYVAKDSIKPPPRVVKGLDGPWITRWGGNVRAGKYKMGQGTDRILELFGNGDAMLIAALALVVLFFVLLQFRPDAPPPSLPPT